MNYKIKKEEFVLYQYSDRGTEEVHESSGPRFQPGTSLIRSEITITTTP